MVVVGVAAAAAVVAAVTAAVMEVVAAAAVAALMVVVEAASFAATVAVAPENAPLETAVEPAEIIVGNLKTWSAATEKVDLSAAVRAVFDFAANAMMVIQGQTLRAFASAIVAETKSFAS